MRGRRRAAQRGVTLIELMVSLVLFSFAIAGVLAVAVSMAQGYRMQRQTVATEGAARNAMEFIADAVRGASPAVSGGKVEASSVSEMQIGAIQDVQTCVPGSIKVTNATNAPDELEVVFASGGAVTSLRTGYDAATNVAITVNDPRDFAAGDTLLLTDGAIGRLVRATSVNPNTGVIALETPGVCAALNLPASGYPPGTLVVRAQRARFSIGTSDGIPNMLLMDPDPDNGTTDDAEPLAENVEDMQIALGVDVDNDSIIDDDEWAFAINSPSIAPGPSLRAVRITLSVRAAQELIGGQPAWYRPAAEDRAGSTAPDKYRRRQLSTVVEIRNLGGSP